MPVGAVGGGWLGATLLFYLTAGSTPWLQSMEPVLGMWQLLLLILPLAVVPVALIGLLEHLLLVFVQRRSWFAYAIIGILVGAAAAIAFFPFSRFLLASGGASAGFGGATVFWFIHRPDRPCVPMGYFGA